MYKTNLPFQLQVLHENKAKWLEKSREGLWTGQSNVRGIGCHGL